MQHLLTLISMAICLLATPIARAQSPAILLQQPAVNTGLYERDFALSPDGREAFYTVQGPGALFQTIVYVTKNKRGQWSRPQVAPFAGRFSSLEPAFTHDGQRLYFSSNRPLSGDSARDFDIWYVDRQQGQWSKPVHLGAPVNTPADEFYPSITRSGNLYFTANYKNGPGREDIYMAAWQHDHYLPPVALDSNINSKLFEFNAFVSPAEDRIIFTGYGRPDDQGRGDLYMSCKDAAGNWQPAVNLSFINSNQSDYCPFISFNGQYLYFTSERHGLGRQYDTAPNYNNLSKQFSGLLNGNGNIYRVGMKAIEKFYEEAVND